MVELIRESERTVIAEKPRITKFEIDWEGKEQVGSEVREESSRREKESEERGEGKEGKEGKEGGVCQKEEVCRKEMPNS